MFLRCCRNARRSSRGREIKARPTRSLTAPSFIGLSYGAMSRTNTARLRVSGRRTADSGQLPRPFAPEAAAFALATIVIGASVTVPSRQSIESGFRPTTSIRWKARSAIHLTIAKSRIPVGSAESKTVKEEIQLLVAHRRRREQTGRHRRCEMWNGGHERMSISPTATPLLSASTKGIVRTPLLYLFRYSDTLLITWLSARWSRAGQPEWLLTELIRSHDENHPSLRFDNVRSRTRW